MRLFGVTNRVILQAEAAECGVACVAMIAAHHGRQEDLHTLRASGASSMRGMNLTHLMRLAESLELSGRAVRLEPSALGGLRLPCILHWTMDHFVVLEKVTGKGVVIIDPAIGRRTVAHDTLDKSFTGVALELTPTTRFVAADKRAKLSLSAFLKDIRGLGPNLVKLLVISSAIQVIGLVIPFFSQVVIDDVVVDQDKNLLLVLALGFGALACVQVLLTVQRSLFTLTFAARIQFDWASRLFNHLIRLPLGYFERRSTADVLSRFRSIASIQKLASATIVDALMDGMTTILVLGIMLIYDASLATVSIAVLLGYVLVRSAFYRRQKEFAIASLTASAREDGHVLESLRAISAIKVFGGESLREGVWQNLCASAIRERTRVDAFRSLEANANLCLLGIENIVVLSLGVNQVITGTLTVGMLVAFLAYKTQFTSRASSLIDKIMEFRLAEVDLERLSDIALTERSVVAPTAGVRAVVDGSVVLKDVAYRYSKNEAWILKDCNFSVGDGEAIVISAPSGTGKTTLLKIMMGLIEPTAGEVVICGLDAQVDQAIIRKRVAAVMQDDSLLSGTIGENICFFDATPDWERIKRCAEAAAIDGDINRFPMGYNTLVGDSGTAVSGGQKQRLLLARALYAQPVILFLDEATSHLDVAVERRIHDALASLNITRIMVAHRAETLAIADRVVSWEEITPSAILKPSIDLAAM